MKIIIGIFVIVLLFLSFKYFAFGNEDYLIKPGVGIGKFKLGETKKYDIFGSGKTGIAYEKEGLFLVFGPPNDMLIEIWIKKEQYQTDKGVGIGDSVDKLIELHNARKISESKPKILKEEGYTYEGIVFLVDTETQLITSIVLRINDELWEQHSND